MTHEYLLRASEAFGGKNDAMVTERVMTPSSSSCATKSEINSVTDREVIQKLQQVFPSFNLLTACYLGSQLDTGKAILRLNSRYKRPIKV